jgi:hypothetical protein
VRKSHESDIAFRIHLEIVRGAQNEISLYVNEWKNF